MLAELAFLGVEGVSLGGAPLARARTEAVVAPEEEAAARDGHAGVDVGDGEFLAGGNVACGEGRDFHGSEAAADGDVADGEVGAAVVVEEAVEGVEAAVGLHVDVAATEVVEEGGVGEDVGEAGGDGRGGGGGDAVLESGDEGGVGAVEGRGEGGALDAPAGVAGAAFELAHGRKGRELPVDGGECVGLVDGGEDEAGDAARDRVERLPVVRADRVDEPAGARIVLGA